MAWFPCCCGLTNTCCPGVQLPTVFRGTFTSECPCVDGITVALSYSVIEDRWIANTINTCIEEGEIGINEHDFVVFCSGSIWGLAYIWFIFASGSPDLCVFSSFSPGQTFSPPSSVSCDPFVLVFEGLMYYPSGFSGAVCPCEGMAWTLTITI